MRQRPLVHALFLLLATGAAAVAAPTGPVGRPQLPTDVLPEHVLYGQMFRHVVALEKHADALEKRGEDGNKFRFRYKQTAGLSDHQDDLLKAVARECMARVAEQDRKALEVIRAVRAQTPDRRLAPGQIPPAPPTELAELQEERNAMILEARDRLRDAFGAEEFERLDTFLRKNLGSHIRQLSPAIQRPEGHRQPVEARERQ